MACPRYTVTPGTTANPARFGLPVTLQSLQAEPGFGVQPGQVSLVCGDTVHPLPDPIWTQRLISVILVQPPTPCSNPSEISVQIPGEAEPCREPIVISEGTTEQGPRPDNRTALAGVTLLGLIAIFCVVALLFVSCSTSSPGAMSPIAQNTAAPKTVVAPETIGETTLATEPTAEPTTTPPSQQAVTEAASSAGALGLLGQISG